MTDTTKPASRQVYNVGEGWKVEDYPAEARRVVSRATWDLAIDQSLVDLAVLSCGIKVSDMSGYEPFGTMEISAAGTVTFIRNDGSRVVLFEKKQP